MNKDAPINVIGETQSSSGLPIDPIGPLSWSLIDLGAVALGGAIGALARFVISHWATHHWPKHAHLATFIVNAVGSLILGAIAGWTLSRTWPDWAHRGIAIGMLGAFTTYSTFAVEAVKLHTQGRTSTALGYVLLTTVVCVAVAALGYWAASKLAGAGGPAI